MAAILVPEHQRIFFQIETTMSGAPSLFRVADGHSSRSVRCLEGRAAIRRDILEMAMHVAKHRHRLAVSLLRVRPLDVVHHMRLCHEQIFRTIIVVIDESRPPQPECAAVIRPIPLTPEAYSNMPFRL